MKFKKLKSFDNPHTYIFIIPIVFIVILQILGFDGLYGQDSYEYLRYTKAIKEYFIHGTHPGDYYWPVLYPFIGGLLSLIIGSEVLSLNIITTLSLSFCFLYLLKTIKILYPNHQFSLAYIVIFGMLSPFFLKTGLVIMSDVTTAMFIVVTFYYFVRLYTDKQNRIYPILFFATCAVMTRYPSLFITFPLILYALYLVIKRKAIKDFLIAICTSFLVCIPFFVFQGDSIFNASSNYFFNSWSLMNYFKSSYTTIDGLQTYRFPNLIHSLYVFIHPGYIFIGCILSFLCIKNYKLTFTFPQKITVVSILLYVVFLAGIPFQSTRILGLVFPIVLLFFYPYFLQLMEFKVIRKNLVVLGIVSVVFQLSLWIFTFQHPYKRAVFEKEMVKVLTPYQGKKLYSFDIDISIQGRGLDFEYKNLYMEKYNDFKKNDLVLFNPMKFSKQWVGKNPMINWNFLKENYQLKIIEECPNGWKLYQIQ